MFHASTNEEREEILAAFRSEQVLVSPVLVAPDLPVGRVAPRDNAVKASGALRLVTVARIARNKNILGAIEMLQGIAGSISFHIYGPREDSDYWAECEAMIRKLSTNVVVRYCGELDPAETSSRISQYDAFLLPTHGENFGHSIVEALSGGCPVIISDRTPWKALAERSAGWAIPLGAPEMFREVLASLVKMGEKQHQLWRTGARAYAAAIVSNPTAVDENRALFRAVIAGHSQGRVSTRQHHVAKE